MRGMYIFSNNGNRQLMTHGGGEEEDEGMGLQYGEALVEATMNELVKREHEQPRDLQPRPRFHGGGGGALTASAPRTTGFRNYGTRAYGVTSYGYGKGMLVAVKGTQEKRTSSSTPDLISHTL